MPYQGTIYRVMIASPSDVPAERQVIRDTIHDWNVVHSADRRIALLPLGWDTHAAPSMSDRPQAVINKQVLKDADLLIAVFWTRLGTPSGRAPSGTVEEINEHLTARKPAMLYFSNAPVRLDSVDESQYRSLKSFRDDCMRRGLCASYDSVEQFRELVARQLAQTVIREFVPSTAVGSEGAPLARSVPSLSPEAITILRETADDASSELFRLEHASGVSFMANGKTLFDGYGGREHVAWEDGLQALVRAGLLRQDGQIRNGASRFTITSDGFAFTDRLGT